MLNSLKTKELEALIHVSKTIIAHLDLDTALELIMSVTTDVMKVEASSLFLIDDDLINTQAASNYGFQSHLFQEIDDYQTIIKSITQ